MSPTPKRQEGWTCPDCNSWNESTNARCRSCQTATPPTPQAAVTPFQFPATGQQVRAAHVFGQPWFVAADVCAVLDLHTGRALARIDEDEKGVRPTQTPGGMQSLAYVNEPGLYSLILGSRKPEAKAFKRWVTHEVLPAIRRTGSYVPAVAELSRRDLARMVIEEADRADAAEQRAAELAGPAHAWDVLASGKGDYSVADAAKILSRDPEIAIGRDRLFTHMEAVRWIHRQRADGRWRAYQQQVDNGRLSELPQSYEHPRTREITLGAPQLRITPKGVAALHRDLGGVAPLRLDEQTAIGGAS